MKIAKAIRSAAHATANFVAVSLAALFLAGPVSFCLCDDDPDNCGEACHDCTGTAADDCNHATIDVDDFTLSHNDNTVDTYCWSEPIADFYSATRFEARQIFRPAATSPPDRSWAYTSYSSRTNPIS